MLKTPLAILAAAVLCGCMTSPTEKLPDPPGKDVVKPIVAIGEFENRSSYHGQWALGPGVSDLLVAETLGSKHFVVVERERLAELVGELRQQQSEMFRPQGRQTIGRLKNAAYHIRGAITDFTHISRRSVEGSKGDWLLGSSGYTARVALVLTIVEVESGQIIESVNAAGYASANGLIAEGEYRDVRFGGDAFFRTPLGIATRNAIRQGLRKIIAAVPKDPWSARIAAVEDDRVILTGGQEQGQRIGMELVVLDEDRTIHDPSTGDAVDVLPGAAIGRLRITEVRPRTAIARIVQGAAKLAPGLRVVTAAGMP